MNVKDMVKDIVTKTDLDNIINKHGLNYQDSEGESYLHELARTGKIDLLHHLFDNNRTERYNINLKNNFGRTALYDAMNEQICEFLIIQRIDYKSRDNEGKLAEEVNTYANYILRQKCNETRKKILKKMKIIY